MKPKNLPIRPAPKEPEWIAFKASTQALMHEAIRKSATNLFAYLDEWLSKNGHDVTLFRVVDEEPFTHKTRSIAQSAIRDHMGEVREELAHRYPSIRPQEYIGYHVVVGSSPMRYEAPKFDLPGPYSIISYFERIIRSEEPLLQPEGLLAYPSPIARRVIEANPLFTELLTSIPLRPSPEAATLVEDQDDGMEKANPNKRPLSPTPSTQYPGMRK
jgi:hypothetical protein